MTILSRNFPLYLLAASNLIYAFKNGFSWLTYLALGLAVIVLFKDIMKAVNEKNSK